MKNKVEGQMSDVERDKFLKRVGNNKKQQQLMERIGNKKSVSSSDGINTSAVREIIREEVTYVAKQLFDEIIELKNQLAEVTIIKEDINRSGGKGADVTLTIAGKTFVGKMKSAK